MRKLLAALLVVPLGVVLVALAVVNRKPVTLGLNPFDGDAAFGIQGPFFLFLLGGFALGLIVGGLVTWLGQGRWRLMARSEAREARAWRRQAERLERELESTEAKSRRLPAA